MAIFFPYFEKFPLLKVKPEPGELFLLNFLKDNLDDSFEVYFQTFLNGDRPDIIIMRKDYGAFIIEVKDWDLNHYYMDTNRKWRLKKNQAYLKSPIDQVLRYKENIYNLHIPNLLESKIKDFRYWSIVSCGVYFHNETSEQLKSFIIDPFKDDKDYINDLKWNIELIGRDYLIKREFDQILNRRYLLSNYKSKLFSEDLYKSFKRYLQPIQHTKDEGVPIEFSSEQKRLIISTPKELMVKGVMGSGKTTILAHRAVTANKRTGKKVLILTFNITLKNFIHDKINNVQADFDLNDFYITNYHNFISAELNNLGIDYVLPEDFSEFNEKQKSLFWEENYYSNINLFDDYSDQITKYETILIDEVQDYKKSWMEMIKKFFLAKGGEYILYGDEKQNIFGNKIENKEIITNIDQKPIELKKCFRSDHRIKDLAINFQQIFFQGKYNIDDFNNTQLKLLLEYENSGYANYIYLPSGNSIVELYNIVIKNSKRLKEHPNDITILSSSIDSLRKFDFYYRMRSNERTNTMFETVEIWSKVFLDLNMQHEIAINGVKLFSNSKLNKDDLKRSKLAVCLSLENFYREFQDETFKLKLDENLRKYNIKCSIFREWYDSFLKGDFKKSTQLSNNIKNIRDNKKFNFWPNPGTLKLSTIHSFKGWEANTLFLLIEPNVTSSSGFSFDELIYTGMTRSKHNLVMINFGNDYYHNKLKTLFEKQ